MTGTRQTIGVAAATAVVLVVFGIVLAFGGISYPAFPSLADEPDDRIEGSVAFLRSDEKATCLHVVASAGGRPRTLRCEDMSVWHLRFDAEGRLEMSVDAPGGSETVVVDPRTGQVVDRRWERDWAHDPVDPPGYVRGRKLVASDHGEDPAIHLLERNGRRREVLRVDGPRDYGFLEPSWSPDGRWGLVADTAGRLLVVDPWAGDARLLVEDAALPVWGP